MTVIVQKAVVTMAASLDQYVETTPAINTTQVQQLGVAVAGADQTVTVRPVE